MKPTPELTYEYRMARQRALDKCALESARLYKLVPRLGEIASERKSLAFDMGLALVKSSDSEATKASYQQKIAALTAEEQAILKDMGLPHDHLAPKFRCSLCEDTGYVGEVKKQMCSCMKQRLISLTFGDAGLDKCQTFDAMLDSVYPSDKQRTRTLKAKKICMDYAQSFPNAAPADMLLMGGTGLGKSHLLNATALEISKRGYAVYKTSAYNLINGVMDSIRSRTDAPDFLSPDLMVIDDLGTEPMINSVTRETLFSVMNERQAAGKATLWATNLGAATIQDNYGDRFYSRLISPRLTAVLRLEGEDLRRILK